MPGNNWGEIYRELGARPVINAIGSVTMLGGSTPFPEVKEAMERADDAYVPLVELEQKAGEATAAFMAGDDDSKIQQLPDTTRMKNEILIQKRQRYWYDRCLQLAGARLVEFGSDDGTTRDDLEIAIGPNTAAVHYYAVEQAPHPKALSLEDTLDVTRAKGVPVMVDSAGQIYPLENLGK